MAKKLQGRPPKATQPEHPFGLTVWQWIKDAGITQTEAARVLRVSPRSVARWLNGGPYPLLATQRRLTARILRARKKPEEKMSENEWKAAFRKLSTSDKLGVALAETRHMAEGLFNYFNENGIANGDIFEVLSDVAVAHDRLSGAIRLFKDRYGIEIPVKEVEL